MRRYKLILPVLLLICCVAGRGIKLRQVAMIDLSGDPGFNQVTMANDQVVITRPATNTIEIFSPIKRRVIARISQVENPRGIAVDDHGALIYVALAGSNRIAVINSKTWKAEKLITVAHRPERLLWVPETGVLYATSLLDRSLTIIDPKSGAQTAVVELNALPDDLLYDTARHVLLVTLQDLGEVAAIDSSNQIVGQFKLEASEPTGLALDDAHRRLYVAVRYAILVLNADTGAEVLRIPAPGGINTLLLDPGANVLYAAAGDGSVLSIDLTRNLVDQELPTDVKSYTMAYDPSRKMLFLPGGREGRSKMVILSPMPAGESAPATAQKSNPAAPTTAK